MYRCLKCRNKIDFYEQNLIYTLIHQGEEVETHYKFTKSGENKIEIG